MAYRLGYFQQSDDTVGLRIWRGGELVGSFGNRNHMPACHELEIEGKEFFADSAALTEIVRQLIGSLRSAEDMAPDPDEGCQSVSVGPCVFDVSWRCHNRQELIPFLEGFVASYTRAKQLLTLMRDGQERVCSDMTEGQIDHLLEGEPVPVAG